MAIASAKAQARSIGTKILPAASGLRPIDSIACEPIMPIATAGAIAPTAITTAFANGVNSIIFYLLLLIMFRLYNNLTHCYFVPARITMRSIVGGFVMIRCSNGKINYQQHGKYQRLDNSHQYF